ncbi:MAG: winged helix DNA-binding protein [Candidatus Bathyarchaeia archaeon]
MEPLEQTGSIRILLFLSKKGATTLTEIKDNVNCSLSAIYNALRKLKDAGLIQEELEKEFPRRRLVSLTDKGRKVAEKLEEIERILGDR